MENLVGWVGNQIALEGRLGNWERLGLGRREWEQVCWEQEWEME